MIKPSLTSMMRMAAYSTSAHCQLNIEAISNNLIDIPSKEYHNVQYKISNPDTVAHRFTVQDIPGMLVLDEGPNDCHQQSTLAAYRSCTQNLKLPVKPLNDHGTSLCNAKLTNCIEPKYDERLTAAILPEGTPTISLQIGAITHKDNANLSTFRGKACKHSHKIKKAVFGNTVVIDQDCNIEIFSGVRAFYGFVQVLNTSSVPIYFTPPTSDFLDDSPNASSCTTSTNSYEVLHPGQCCFFYYPNLDKGCSGTPQTQSFMVYPASNNFDYNYQLNYNRSTQVDVQPNGYCNFSENISK